MTTLESIVLSYLANAIWQVPLLYVVGWITARVLRPVGPGAEHQAWVGVLLLQASCPRFPRFPGAPLAHSSISSAVRSTTARRMSRS